MEYERIQVPRKVLLTSALYFNTVARTAGPLNIIEHIIDMHFQHAITRTNITFICVFMSSMHVP